jgi:uncharacterized protein YuzE
MKITWDEKAKAVYIYLTKDEKIKVARSQRVSDQIFLDFVADAPVGIEILNADKPIIECIGGA